ncbi:MAG TPA: FAD-dependent thymidylate synthase [Candidatus Atribacteria bacterium]|nr:FAD-dependent thymidylate synthase [Candidatus Atribacteria bacterium]
MSKTLIVKRPIAQCELINYTPDPVGTVLTAAGVSYNKKKTKRLQVLMGKEFHESPFRHVHFTFRLKVPLYIFRQLQRAEVGRDFVERSLRYTKISSTDDFYWTHEYEKDHIAKSINMYEAMISINNSRKSDDGEAQQEARRILPQSMFVTSVVTVSLSWLLRLLKDRVFNESAQPNTRRVALFIIKALSEYVYEDSGVDLITEVFDIYAQQYLGSTLQKLII